MTETFQDKSPRFGSNKPNPNSKNPPKTSKIHKIYMKIFKINSVSRPWIVLVCAFGSIGVLLAMFVHAHNVPMNYFLLAGWTVMQALTVAAIGKFFFKKIVNFGEFSEKYFVFVEC